MTIRSTFDMQDMLRHTMSNMEEKSKSRHMLWELYRILFTFLSLLSLITLIRYYLGCNRLSDATQEKDNDSYFPIRTLLNDSYWTILKENDAVLFI